MRWSLLAIPLIIVGCRPTITPTVTTDTLPPDWFTNVAKAAGIDATYRNGEDAEHFAILESLGGGLGWIDFDQDGQLDLVVTGGGHYTGADRKTLTGYPTELYRNLGSGKFAKMPDGNGLNATQFYSHGVAVGDYDCDGFPDVLITGYGQWALYHNVPGDAAGRRFVETTQAAGLHLDRHFWSSSAAWADFDGDGFPDLYVCQYVDWSWGNNPPCPGYSIKQKQDVCPPKQFGSVAHALFRNKGDGTFQEVTREAGLRIDNPEKDYGKGLGILVVDVNNDRKPDIYIGNDTTDNFLYLNRSTPGKINFGDVGFNLGVARDGNGIPNGSMGIDATDFDGSGRPSIWVTNYENEFHALYRNETRTPDKLAFTFATPSAGIGAIGPKFVGFGTGFADIDHDGWDDIVIANGHVVRFPPNDNLRQPPILLLNEEVNQRRKFKLASFPPESDFMKPLRGRGLALGDYDNDGAIDVGISCLNEPMVLFHNHYAEVTPGRHWLGIELFQANHHDFVGAKVTIEFADRKLTRFAKGGGSYLSSADRRIVVGLGESTGPVKVTSEWQHGGERTTHEGLAVDQHHRLGK